MAHFTVPKPRQTMISRTRARALLTADIDSANNINSEAVENVCVCVCEREREKERERGRDRERSTSHNASHTYIIWHVHQHLT